MAIQSVLSSDCPFTALAELLKDKTYTAEDVTKNSFSALLKFLKKNDFQRQYDEEDTGKMSVLLQLVQRFAGNEQHIVLPVLKTFIVDMISDFNLATLYSLREETNETFSKLYEEILETINIIAESSTQAKGIVIESFCDRLLQVVSSSTFKFTIKIETLKSINNLLEKCPVVVREKMRKSKTHVELMYKLGRSVATAGDYELQVGMIEALFRLTHQKDRKDMAKVWFTDHVHFQAFEEVKDSDFETDCRQFLNIVNGDIAGNASVWSYPCQYAELGHVQLHKPVDKNYTEFWVDFNTSSKRISLFCQGLDDVEESLWETVTLWEDNIQEYVLELHGKSTNVTLFLDVDASELTTLCSQNIGKEVRFAFSAQFDIDLAIKTTFPTTKNTVKEPKGPKTKVSAVMHGIPIVGCEFDAEVGLCDSQVSKHKRSKMSVAAVPMSAPTCTLLNPHESSLQHTSASKETKLSKVQTPKTPKTPKTPTSKVKGKRVKTPLQLVSGSGDAVAIPSRRPMKVSMTLTPIACYEHLSESQQDVIVPSSVPEEMPSIADSQTVSQTFPVLTNFRNDKNGDNSSHNVVHDNRVAITPCLSTITEESGRSMESAAPKSGRTMTPCQEAYVAVPSPAVSQQEVKQKSTRGHSFEMTSRTGSSQKEQNKFIEVQPIENTSQLDNSQREPNHSQKESKKPQKEPKKSTKEPCVKTTKNGSNSQRKQRSNKSSSVETLPLSDSIKETDMSPNKHVSLTKTSSDTDKHDSQNSCNDSGRRTTRTSSNLTENKSDKGTSEKVSSKKVRTTRSKRSSKTVNYNDDDKVSGEVNQRQTRSLAKRNEVVISQPEVLPDSVDVVNRTIPSETQKTHVKCSKKMKVNSVSYENKCDSKISKENTEGKGVLEKLHSEDDMSQNRNKTIQLKLEEKKKEKEEVRIEIQEEIPQNLDEEMPLSNKSSQRSLTCIKETQMPKPSYDNAAHDNSDSDVPCGQMSSSHKRALNSTEKNFSALTRKPDSQQSNGSQSSMVQERSKQMHFFKSRNQELPCPQKSPSNELYDFESDEEMGFSSVKAMKHCKGENKHAPKESTKSKTTGIPAVKPQTIGKQSSVCSSNTEANTAVPQKKSSKNTTVPKQTAQDILFSKHVPEISKSSDSHGSDINFSDMDEYELFTEDTPRTQLKNASKDKSSKKKQNIIGAKTAPKTTLKNTSAGEESFKKNITNTNNKYISMLNSPIQSEKDIEENGTSVGQLSAVLSHNVLPEGDIDLDMEGTSNFAKKTLCEMDSLNVGRAKKRSGTSGKGGEIKQNNQKATAHFKEGVNALEKSLSVKFGLSNWHPEPLVTTNSRNKSTTKAGFVQKSKPTQEMKSAETSKKSIKRKRQPDPYDYNLSDSEKQQTKKPKKKHRSVFSETEESRSEISWLASTGKRREKKRRVVKTYTMKKTMTSQQSNASLYDFNSDSEENIPMFPIQKKQQPAKPPHESYKKQPQKKKTRKSQNKDKSCKEALSLFMNKINVEEVHISPVQTPRTPRQKQSSSPGEMEIVRLEKSPSLNTMILDSPLVQQISEEDALSEREEMEVNQVLHRPDSVTRHSSFTYDMDDQDMDNFEAANLLNSAKALKNSFRTKKIRPTKTPKVQVGHHTKQSAKRTQKKKVKNNTSNTTCEEALNLLKGQDQVETHLSPIMTPKTPKSHRSNTSVADEIECARHEKSRSDNLSPFGLPDAMQMDDVESGVFEENACDTMSKPGSDVSARRSNSGYDGTSGRRRNSYVVEPVSTPFNHSVCKEDSIQMPKILFPANDLQGSQGTSSDHEMCTDGQELYNPPSVLASNNQYVSTLINSFSSDVRKSMQAKQEHMEKCAKSISQKAAKQIRLSWSESQQKRATSLNSFNSSFKKEVESLEADIDNFDQLEKKSLVFMKDQVQSFHKTTRAIHKGLERMKDLQGSFSNDVHMWNKFDQQGSRKVNKTLDDGINSFKNNILLDLQQRELQNIRRTLHAMLKI